MPERLDIPVTISLMIDKRVTVFDDTKNSGPIKDPRVQHDLEKLNRMVEKSRHILLKISTVFPFDFFPDDIIIDELKIDIIRRTSWFTESVDTIPNDKVVDVKVDTGPVFAALTIVGKEFRVEPTIINHLWRKDALNAKQLIEAIMFCISHDIDVSNLSYKEILAKVLEASSITGLKG